MHMFLVLVINISIGQEKSHLIGTADNSDLNNMKLKDWINIFGAFYFLMSK